MKEPGWAIFAITVGVALSARARADGLTGLDAKLRATGRVGTLTPQATGPIAGTAPDAGAAERTRDPQRALSRIEDENDATQAAAPDARASGASEEELQQTDGTVAACRIEVARRRRLPPAKIAAGTVVLRFTIEKTGRVREAEALSALDTDLEVAACAKRVLSGWTFTRRERDAVAERSYHFAGDATGRAARAVRD
jgi:hypothetical protein